MRFKPVRISRIHARTANRISAVVGVAALTVGLAAVVQPTAQAGPVATIAPTQAAAGLDDPFYDYTGTKPLRKIKPGTVLNTREVPYSIQGLGLPLKTVQLLYRTTDQRGRAVVNATTVVHPVLPLGEPKVLSYQSFYDSLDPADQPSTVIAGGAGPDSAIVNIETALFLPALLAGYTINIPDTEGQGADFAAGPEYGVNTIDSLRAISRSDLTGVGKSSPIGLIGYSGGAIASEWAAELLPARAPAIAKRLVGTAIGGVFVHPGHNLAYVEGSSVWAGVIPMALVGVARSFGLDLEQYATPYGKKVMKAMDKAIITEVLGQYGGLKWSDIVQKKYKSPRNLKVFVKTVNKLIMGTGGTPNAPMFIGQGTGGDIEGTPASKTYGAGDAVMVAGDVRSLARKYCRKGVTVKYTEYPLSHFTSVPLWLPEAYGWLLQRFAGSDAPTSCGSIAAGNAIGPMRFVRP